MSSCGSSDGAVGEWDKAGQWQGYPSDSFEDGDNSLPLRLCCLPLSPLSLGKSEFTISNAHRFCCPKCRRAITSRLRLFLPLGQLQWFLFKGLIGQSQRKRPLNPQNLLNLLFWTRKTFHPRHFLWQIPQSPPSSSHWMAQ